MYKSIWRKLGAVTAVTLLLLIFLFSVLTPNTLAQKYAPNAAEDDLIITAVFDGPLSGGVPKGVELYVVNNIPDLSIYGLGSANNGGGSDGQEFTFPADSAAAGDFIYVASESPGFLAFFGFDPDYTSSAMGVNGDDAIELFANGSVSDVFGDINVDGTGQPWEYMDGWAYRNNNTGPDGSTFVLANWSFSGPNALDGETTNDTAATPVPIGTYSIASPGLNIGKSAPALVAPGALFTYTISITNNTGITTTGTVITDVVPANSDFASASDGGVEAGGVVSWTIAGDFVDGASIQRTFAVTATTSSGVDIVNDDYGVKATEWVTVTTGAPVTTTVSPLDLSITKTGPAYGMIGGTVVYTVTINNQGTANADNVIVTDTLPISTTLVASDMGAATNPAPGVYAWDLGTILSNTMQTYYITVTVDAGVASGTILTNMIAATTSTSGDELSNNVDTWETAVYPLVSIYDIQHVADPVADDASPYEGQTVWVEGVVTAQSGELGSGTAVIQDPAGGAWTGLPLFHSSIPATAEGDYIRAVGVVNEQFGLTQLSLLSADAVEQLGTMPVPAPAVITTTSYADTATAEQWEGVYLEFQDATVTALLSFGEWEFDDGSGAAVADDLGESNGTLTYQPTLGDAYTFIRGIGWYSFGAYKLEPRYDVDIAFSAPSIAKTAPGLVDPGQLFTYTITIDNRVGYDLTNVVITDTVPFSATFAFASDGGALAGGVVSWTVPTAGNWTTVERSFAVTATTVVNAEIVNQDYGFHADNWITATMGSPITTTTSANVCGEAYTAVYDIQGSGPASPYDGTALFTEGVVTAVYTQTNQTNGFYLQDPLGDGNDATSDGIFVLDFDANVTIGDAVRVAGTVDEFFDFTEINNVSSILSCGTDVVTPTLVSLPIASLDDWEQYEGMLLSFPELYVTEHYNLGRYGQVSLSINDRLFQPTNVITPGQPALDLLDLNDRSRILLDDTYTNQNPDPIVYPAPGLSYTNTLRGGDMVSNLLGVMEYAFGEYRVQPVGDVTITAVNERPAATENVGGSIRVASFNVLNYFTTIDDGIWICGPSGDMECRGADSVTEFERQRTKIITAMLSIDADVFGLMEIENNGYDASSAIQDLVNGLNDIAGAGTYAFIDPGVSAIGTDAIAVGLIYKPASVTPAGSAVILDSSVDPNFNDDKNRPALAQAFADNVSGEIFTVAVNHLKSKGSPCDDIGDPDAGDGQGNCNLTRTAAAEALVTWLASDPTGSGSAYNLIIGDLNSYAMEDPITAIKDGGYTNLLSQFGGLHAYSYVFDGQFGYLDHGLASAELTPFITGAMTWHINADEPRSLDYNEEFKTTGQLTTLYGPGPYRASDHDPVVIGLAFEHKIYLPIIISSSDATAVSPETAAPTQAKLPFAWLPFALVAGVPMMLVSQKPLKRK